MRLAARTLMLLGVAASVACFRGDEREKEAPPGLPGGLCLAPQPPAAPDPFCEQGLCNMDRNYCYDPADPCDGFFCGGSERGFCQPDSDLQPTCTCEPGFSNAQYDLYCCPQQSTGILDPRCNAGASPGGSEDSGGADDARGTEGSGTG
jgi:hypothetical protein